jgi:hypothetical protein
MALPTIDDYLARVTSEHNNQPNYMAMMRLLLQPIVDNQNFLASLPAAFDVDQAIGVQLDVDGIWIGRSRNVVVPQVIDYFSFDIPHLGFDTTAVWYEPGAPLTYSNTFALNDDDYRRLLYSKIAANSWDGTALGATAALQPYLSTYGKPFVLDLGGMRTQICFAGGVLSDAPLSVFAYNYIPIKPSGVSAEYLVASAPGPIFGFDITSDYIAGFDEGAWGVSPDYLIMHNFGPTQFVPFSQGATGPTLDIPGQLIGPPRIVSVKTPIAAFAFDTPGCGFDGPAWYVEGAPIYSITPESLDDSDYSDLLEMAMAESRWDGGPAGLAKALQVYFKTESISVTQDASGWTILFSGADLRPIDIALLNKTYLPKNLAGMPVTFTIASAIGSPVFGFDLSDGLVAGFDEGAWGVSPDWLALHPDLPEPQPWVAPPPSPIILPSQPVDAARFITVLTPPGDFAFDTDGRGFDAEPTSRLEYMGEIDFNALLAARMAAYEWDGTAGGMADIIGGLFPAETVLVEQRNNQWSATLIGPTPSPIMQAVFNAACIPIDAAITFRIVSTPDTPAFGFDENNSAVAGFDIGAWAAEPNNPTAL